MEKCQHSSAPAEPLLCSSASGTWRTHIAGQGDSAELSNVPSLTVSPVTANCVLTQLEFLQSLHKRRLHKPCASPCVGLPGAELCHWHREINLWAFPHLKLESQPFHCSLMFQLDLWHLYWPQEPAPLTSALMLLHRLSLSAFHIWGTAATSNNI